jgi:hypothetical protein
MGKDIRRKTGIILRDPSPAGSPASCSTAASDGLAIPAAQIARSGAASKDNASDRTAVQIGGYARGRYSQGS